MSARPLTVIAAEMRELADAGEFGSKGDPEIAHLRADDLLIEALRWLAAGSDVEDTAAIIWENWERVPKWYA